MKRQVGECGSGAHDIGATSSLLASEQSLHEGGAPAASTPSNPEDIENLRAFFAILQEWDEMDRRETDHLALARQERATETLAEHFKGGVESQ